MFTTDNLDSTLYQLKDIYQSPNKHGLLYSKTYMWLLELKLGNVLTSAQACATFK